jgi:hypothetical protein
MMPKWITVYKGGSTSYLCKWYGDHYEIEGEGPSSSIKDIADRLNREDAHGS